MGYHDYYYVPEVGPWQRLWNELGAYFGFGETSASLAMIIWAIYVGLMISFVIVIYQKRVVGNFVRTLNEKANCPETAVTLAELGYSKAVHIKRLLTTKNSLTGLVYMVGEDATDDGGELVPTLRSKVNWASAKFYIPAERKYRVEVRFEKKGTHFGWVILSGVVFFVVAALAVRWLPDLLELASRFFPERPDPWN